MTLPENTLKYDTCSLQELRQFVTDRKIPFKYIHAQSHTKKSQIKKEKEERCKLLAVLQKNDATATFRFFDLSPELRDEVYWHFFIGMSVDKLQTVGTQSRRLWIRLLPAPVCDEMNAVFETVRQSCEKGIKKDPSFRKYHLRINMGTERIMVFCGGGTRSLDALEPTMATQPCPMMQPPM